MHATRIETLAVVPDGRYAVTASSDKTARVWNLRTGDLLQVLRPPIDARQGGRVYAVAISPDGETVAAGGFTVSGPPWTIYFFDRASGRLTRRITTLPSRVKHLTYSTNGRLLGAVLGPQGGVRVFDARDGTQRFADDYGADTYWAEFDRTDRLVTASRDGYVRLYSRDFQLIAKQQPRGGDRPDSARFSPDGALVAVGFDDSNAVAVLSGQDLRLLYFADTVDIANGNLSTIAWSRDGRTLYAAGMYDVDGDHPIVSWDDAGRGHPRRRPLSRDTVMGLEALPNGALAYAAADPLLGVLGVTWSPHRAEQANFRGAPLQLAHDGRTVAFSYQTTDGETIHAGWSVGRSTLERDPPTATLRPPRAVGLPIANWKNTEAPRLADKRLPLQPYETSRSLAVTADGRSFLLGTNWYLRNFDATGQELWRSAIPGDAWAVNSSDDGAVAVAALDDGTIRWYRASDGAELLALFVHADGRRWVAWTPQGFFDAGGGGEALVGYHLNRGLDHEGELIRLAQVQDRLYRPDLVAHALDAAEQKGVAGASSVLKDVLGSLASPGLIAAAVYNRRPVAVQNGGEELVSQLASGLPPDVSVVGSKVVRQSNGEYTLELQVDDRGGGVGRIEYRINGVQVEGRPFDINVPGRRRASLSLVPGANTITAIAYNARGEIASEPATVAVEVAAGAARPDLYGLLVGVSQYRDANLHLNFAHQDAVAVEQSLRHHAQALFGKVDLTPLSNERATRAAIESALADVAQKAQPQDVFVLYLAGHGISLDGTYHFIPADLVYENEASLRDGGLSAERLKALLGQVKAQKSVLIIDTCQSGGLATGGLTTLASRGPDEKAALSRLTKATGRAVLAATSEQKWALEGYEQHGVFTYALLQGLGADAQAADNDHNGEIDVDELAQYLARTVPQLTTRKWGVEQYPVRELSGQSFPLGRYRPD